MSHPYWNDLWPGYDKPRGLPCCKTNERGYPCSCAEPAPIPEGAARPDPYRREDASFGIDPKTIDGLKEQIKARLAAKRAEREEKPPLYSSGIQYDDDFDDALGQAPGLYRPRPSLARLRREPIYQKQESLCAFEHNGSCFMAQTQRPFRPLGLMIWGAPEGATMEAAYVGNMMQLLVSMGKFPAAWFSQSQSFEQIFERAKEGLVPASFGSWDTCEVGVLLRVRIESKTGASLGPQDGVQIGMWGYSVSL